jgi:hypothetical protein
MIKMRAGVVQPAGGKFRNAGDAEHVMLMKSDEVGVHETLKTAKPEPFRAPFHILQHSLPSSKRCYIPET